MQEEKYGFVYIWFDKKRRLYYIGSHWGTEDDGYICSSNRMRDAYRRRPLDFKRRIIEKTDDRNLLLKLEQNWLSLAGKNPSKYYNMCFSVKNPWWDDEYSRKTLGEKISIKTKEAMQRPDVRKNYEEGLRRRDNRSSDPKVSEKRSQSMIATMAEKFPVENRYKPLTDEERFEYYSNKAKVMHRNRTDEKKEEVGKKISDALKGKQNRLGQKNSDEHRKKISQSLIGHPRHRVSIDGVIYDSARHAEEFLSVSYPTIQRRLKSDKYKDWFRIR